MDVLQVLPLSRRVRPFKLAPVLNPPTLHYAIQNSTKVSRPGQDLPGRKHKRPQALMFINDVDKKRDGFHVHDDVVIVDHRVPRWLGLVALPASPAGRTHARGGLSAGTSSAIPVYE